MLLHKIINSISWGILGVLTSVGVITGMVSIYSIGCSTENDINRGGMVFFDPYYAWLMNGVSAVDFIVIMPLSGFIFGFCSMSYCVNLGILLFLLISFPSILESACGYTAHNLIGVELASYFILCITAMIGCFLGVFFRRNVYRVPAQQLTPPKTDPKTSPANDTPPPTGEDQKLKN